MNNEQTPSKELILSKGSKELIHSKGSETSVTSSPLKPKQEILDEDTYTDALSEIIKKDFFPSLLTLEAQHDYVDAWNSNNPDLIRDATRKLNELTTPSRKTNAPTPKLTPGLSGSQGGWDTPVSTTGSNVFKVPAPKKKIMRKANEQRKEKYKWMYDKEKDSDDKDKPKLIEGSSQDKPAEIESWKYKVRNSLMFYPEGQDQVPEENSRRAPKQIVHNATRFESTDEATINNHAAATAAVVGLNPDTTPNQSVSQTPRVGGYSFVSATPSPNPSQIDTSELMTWGMIEGSPLLIGGDQTPGPSFQLPPTPRREIIGMNLSSNASRSIRKRNSSMKSPRTLHSPITRMASPRVRASLLSPAARKLLRKSHLSPKIGVDVQLRASYASPIRKSPPSTPSKDTAPKIDSMRAYDVTPSPIRID
ncbi:nuclear protein Es2-domain-containing protein [Gigaspora rosea]|uniref:Nuclear protein Es2-domain-containing protein n=1 Tax=Gigaspora rosea TaxID=44941 RepID=A0A397VYR9_9GLOM|nr:nuclear protein Es2-domain-containing protein [Gigaspora rosea]